MTLSAQRSRRPGAYGIVPPLLLTAVLVALTVLFVQTWNGIDERRTFGEQERQGVEYLRSLQPVTAALMDMHATTAAGQTASREALNQAMEAVASVDARLGDTLRTSERWAGVRARMESLPEQGLARPPQDIYDAYSETGALLLALHAKVRETSGLIRDPNSDVYHLQRSAAANLPETLVAAGRLAGLVRLATTRGADDEVRTATELNAARSALLKPAEELVQGLQAAADSTDSRQLSGNLLRHLDAYQQAVEGLAAASSVTESSSPNPEQVEAARKAVQEAASQLVDTAHTELDALIVTRLDELAGQRRLAVITAAAGLVLGLILLYLMFVSRRHAASGGARPVAATEPPAAETDSASNDSGDGTSTWDGSPAAARAAATPTAATGAAVANPKPGSRRDLLAQWGRSDVAR